MICVLDEIVKSAISQHCNGFCLNNDDTLLLGFEPWDLVLARCAWLSRDHWERRWADFKVSCLPRTVSVYSCGTSVCSPATIRYIHREISCVHNHRILLVKARHSDVHLVIPAEAVGSQLRGYFGIQFVLRLGLANPGWPQTHGSPTKSPKYWN